MSIISESENIATMTVNHYERILRELDEARQLLESEKITRNHIIQRGIQMQKELDSARAKFAAAIDARDMANEEADKLREQNAKLLDIAERAIFELSGWDDGKLSSASTRFRAELDQLKEGAK